MSRNLDTAKLKSIAISLWKRGGMDTLVKVAPKGTKPNPALTVGYCTTFKYVAGRTAAEIEEIVGLSRGTKLASGADIFVVDPLPQPSQFELRGYSQCPAGWPPTRLDMSLIPPTHPDLVHRNGSFSVIHGRG